MAEIYTSSDDASRGLMTPDASEHINSVLADLGLTGTSPAAASPHEAAVAPDAALAMGEYDPASTAATDGSDDASAILAGPEPASATVFEPAPQAAADTTMPFSAASHAASLGADTLLGSFGMDTLWGSDATSPLLSADGQGPMGRAADAWGGDTIRAPGGFDTIYGGNATIYASGHSAEGHTAAIADGSTIDGSASARALDTGGYDRLATILGGAGDDTIRLHDAAQDHASASTDTQPGSVDAFAGGAGDGALAGYDGAILTIGGDGSDHFAVLGSGLGHDTLDGGMSGDTYWFEDGSSAGTSQVDAVHAGFVPFDDGYSASFADAGGLGFEDTVLSGG